MTATNLVCSKRHRELHVATDGALYAMPSGVIAGIGTKVFSIAHWPGIVTGRGAGIGVTVLAQKMSWDFPTFDDAVDGIEAALPAMLKFFHINYDVELILAGWSRRDDEPQAYVIETSDALPNGLSEAELAAGRSSGKMIVPPPVTLCRLPNATEGPALRDETRLRHWVNALNPDSDRETLVSDLRRLVTLQRLEAHDGLHLVGGFIEHTVVTPDSISHRIIHRWPEDRIGSKIRLKPELVVA